MILPNHVNIVPILVKNVPHPQLIVPIVKKVISYTKIHVSIHVQNISTRIFLLENVEPVILHVEHVTEALNLIVLMILKTVVLATVLTSCMVRSVQKPVQRDSIKIMTYKNADVVTIIVNVVLVLHPLNVVDVMLVHFYMKEFALIHVMMDITLILQVKIVNCVMEIV